MKPDFFTSLNKSLSHEGLISNNKYDKGGYTYKGISRKYHPTWPGWKIIDSIIGSSPLSYFRRGDGGEVLNNNATLQNLVNGLYRTEFWNKIKGNYLPSQLIANEIFDSAINLGVTTASEFLQRTINLLNRNAHLYPDIIVDGIIGSQTLTTLTKCISVNSEKMVFNLLNFYQAKRYIVIMERARSLEIFIGWFNRIDIQK